MNGREQHQLRQMRESVIREATREALGPLRALAQEISLSAAAASNRTPPAGDSFRRGYMKGGAEAFSQIADRLRTVIETCEAAAWRVAEKQDDTHASI